MATPLAAVAHIATSLLHEGRHWVKSISGIVFVGIVHACDGVVVFMPPASAIKWVAGGGVDG